MHWIFVLATFTGIILVEHFAKVAGPDFHNIRPSTWIESAVPYFVDFFTGLGTWIARLSQFYTYLHLDKFMNSIGDIVIPIGKIIISPLWTIVGYYEYVETYIGHQWMIVAGTITIVLLVVVAIIVVLDRYFRFNIIRNLEIASAPVTNNFDAAIQDTDLNIGSPENPGNKVRRPRHG
jgi:hypothetical protein